MKKLVVSTSPHIYSKITTQRIMGDVLIALAPAAIASVVLFGIKALLLLAVCVSACVISEFLFNLTVKKKQTVSDLSACVTGTLLALSLPATTTVWQCIVGSVFAIVIVKCVFGGIGSNFANPAVTARVFMLVAFTSSVAGGVVTNLQDTDLVAGATPLALIKAGDVAELPSLFDMFIGNRAGAIGESCAIALILGGIYLIARRVINWYSPAIFIGTVFVMSLVIKQDVSIALYEVLGGGVVIAAFFMITDYSSTPINKIGKMVFALGCGLITVLIRFWGTYPEGVSFAILLMNIVSPYIEKLCEKKPLGKECK
jgi:electron transport complex protein RnfD